MIFATNLNLSTSDLPSERESYMYTSLSRLFSLGRIFLRECHFEYPGLAARSRPGPSAASIAGQMALTANGRLRPGARLRTAGRLSRPPLSGRLSTAGQDEIHEVVFLIHFEPASCVKPAAPLLVMVSLQSDAAVHHRDDSL